MTKQNCGGRPASDLYAEQKDRAKQRGIRFLFSYLQWVAWWEWKLGPDWAMKRGPKRGQYVMARKKDKGPYAVWNVVCDRAENNCSMKGEKNGFSKLTEDVVKVIYLSHGTLAGIADKYGVSQHTVWDIKSKRYWTHITKDLAEPPRKRAAKLTAPQVIEIYLSTESQKVLSNRFGIALSMIYNIKRQINWKHVTNDLPI